MSHPELESLVQFPNPSMWRGGGHQLESSCSPCKMESGGHDNFDHGHLSLHSENIGEKVQWSTQVFPESVALATLGIHFTFAFLIPSYWKCSY